MSEGGRQLTVNRWRLLFAALGVTVLIGGGVTLLTTVTALGTDCGSVASPSLPISANKDGNFLDTGVMTILSSLCDNARASRQERGTTIMACGLIVILAAVIIRRRPGLGLGPNT